MTAYRRHHYVPEFLLKQWHSGESDELYRLRWQCWGLEVKPKRAGAVGFKEYLYAMKRDSPKPNSVIEPKFMSKHVDDPAAVAHAALIKKGLHGMAEDDKYAWTMFLVSLVFRVPGAIEHLRERGIDALGSQFSEGVNEAAPLTGPLAELHDLYLRRDPSLLDFGTYFLPDLIQTSSYNKLFFEAKWWSVRRLARTKLTFVIGDRPLTQFGRAEELDLLFLPLAPDIAFFVCRTPQMRQWLDAMTDTVLVRTMNRRMVEQASEEVWSADPEHQKLVELRLQKVPAGNGLGFGPRP